MKPERNARTIAGLIYLILALMWSAIIAILISGAGTARLLGALNSNSDSRFVVLTLGAYAAISLLLSLLLLAKRSYHKRSLTMILVLALAPMIIAPFVATDLFGAIIYLIPYLFTYRFYRDYPVAPKTRGNVVKLKRT